MNGSISKYATMHPYEDFAESFAHYLHICDTLDTAREFGLIQALPGGPLSRKLWKPNGCRSPLP